MRPPISPVPTPHIVLRPMTREMTRLSTQDKHRRILRGTLDIRCPHDTKKAGLYISNTGIGMMLQNEQYNQTDTYHGRIVSILLLSGKVNNEFEDSGMGQKFAHEASV